MAILVGWDFETHAIEDFPDYPPKPVGLSIYVKGGQAHYYAFGHESDNNSTEEDAKKALLELTNNPEVRLIAFNRPFDHLVAHVHWGMSLSPQCEMHDAQISAFLLDPHAQELSLKPLAKRHLGMEPDERDEVREWLVAHGRCKDNKTDWAKHIAEAPGSLVGKYANGDTIRTVALFEHFQPQIESWKMQEAYTKRCQFQVVMMKNTLEGIPVNVDKLACDILKYNKAISKAEQLIFELLGTPPFNINSGEQLADALDAKFPGLDWPRTPKGRRSTAKDSLEKVIGSLQGTLLAALQYRASVRSCLNFMTEWYRQATHEKGDGNIHCQWFTTRSDDGGARTGRISSSPNFMNIPTLKSAKFAACLALWAEYLEALEFPALPNVREYIDTCNNDQVLLVRDFASQELRVLAHYEDGDLLAAYKANPKLDMHQWAADTIRELTGLNIVRKQTKTVAFAVMYGSGLTTLAEQMHATTNEASIIKGAYMDAIPGIKRLGDMLKSRAAKGMPLRTFGGRIYHVEPPRFDPKQGRMRTFDYKLLNVLIQGGSSDITMDALLEYDKRKVHGRLLLTVHDEIVVLAPKEHAVSEMQILRECMESIPLDCPLLSDGKIGQNYHELEAFKEAS